MQEKGLVVVLVDPQPQESAEAIRSYLETKKIPLMAYSDVDRNLSNRLAVPATPYYFLIDKDSVVRYAGALETGTPGQRGYKPHLANAIEDVLAGRPVRVKKTSQTG